ncbi:hypothetical protein SUGI_0479470 [Cryptomeria japonica]|nr:hypothetical protein SUGI_0479470 [Cryptomeria japonica]
MITCRLFRQFLLYFCVNQFGLALLHLLASLGQTMVVAFTYGSFSMVVIFFVGGFVLSREDINWWWIWGNGLNQTLGELVLTSRGIFPHYWWYWIGIGALLRYSLLCNVLYTGALAVLKPPGKAQAVVSEEATHEKYANTRREDDLPTFEGLEAAMMSPANLPKEKQGMVLPFKPLSLCFQHISYHVDIPEKKKQDRLRLLHDVSGAFRQGILTAFVGVSGAGKTTLMDVLAGRKSGGYIEGSISISGYAKKQEQFARIAGYCEQNDIHSPHVTVYESLIYSAWLHLPAQIAQEIRKNFVEEVMELVELCPLRNSLVGHQE